MRLSYKMMENEKEEKGRFAIFDAIRSQITFTTMPPIFSFIDEIIDTYGASSILKF